MSDFERQDCIRCFMQFQVPQGFTKRRREDLKTFYCPGCGGTMVYSKGESEADKLRRDLDRAKQNAAYLEDQVRHQRERAEREERRRAALAGQVTKLKKRSSAGVCPCCNRTFVSLARHMAQKHKDFVCEPLADNVIQLERTGT